jgi:phosphoenolpyruvate phosphomutase
MVELAPGKTILSTQIELLTEAGIRDITITTGYLAGQLKEYAQSCCPSARFDFIHNERFRETNYIVSLYNAIGRTQDDILLLHGDLLFGAAALQKVLKAPGSAVAIERTAELPQKDFKARLAQDGSVKEIGIDVFGADCVACQPFYKLIKEDWLLWQKAIEDFCERGIVTVYAEDALNTVTSRMNLMALDMEGELCMEVDNLDDLMLARKRLGFD